MSDSDPPLIPYGSPDTQFGIVTDLLPDGGVVVTIPHKVGLVGQVQQFFADVGYRARITLNREGLEIHRPMEGKEQPNRLHYPLEDVGEVRANRYSRGLYVSIPGRDNFDCLQELDAPVIRYVGETLDAALKRLRGRKGT